MDTDLLWFYVRIWDMRVTDLMQGPVYGLFTDEIADDERLFPFFNYDEIFGTVLNRFVVQAVADLPRKLSLTARPPAVPGPSWQLTASSSPSLAWFRRDG